VKFKVEDLTKHNFLAIAVIHIMTEETRNTNDFIERFKLVPGGNSDVEIDIKINGVEVNFQHFMNELERQHSDMLTKRAHELLKENGVSKLQDIISDLEKNIESKIEEVFPGFREERW
jgi:hypothetical protein